MSLASRARNPISLAGVGLTTATAVAFIAFVVLDTFDLVVNPYAGLFGYALLPACFVLGLLLIPLGIWREGRRRSRGKGEWPWPTVDFRSPNTRRIAVAVTLLSLVNLAIVAVAGFGAAHYMETTDFCGQVCHAPMKPQFTAHQVGPHAAVTCVSCHVGPGASGAVRAKLAGTRQLYQVATSSIPRPIHAGGRIPAAAGTCVNCHKAGFSPRDVTRVIREYSDDEASSETVTTLDMLTTRIHAAHANPEVQIEFAASEAGNEVIGYVKATARGAVTQYFGPGVTAAATGLKRMDCLDCHSRPAHAFNETAERAVDNAIAAGQVERSLPFVRRELVAALKAEYRSETAALAGIEKQIADFYRTSPGRAAEVTRAVSVAQMLYRTNVFPEMKVTWGTHRNQISHINTPGCFRCHTDEHKAPSGKVISQDCEACHKER